MGGMGAVFRARDSRLHRDVAIKVSTEQFSTRFDKEARAIAALNHPHICQIYDIGPDFLVLEYIEGKPVSGPLSVQEAVKLALQIAGAMEEAHSRGILHRDLKPANILVTAKGVAKLLDFGLAKRTTDIDPDVTRTFAGTVMGTVAYMAPEQAEGKPVDERSDVFGFGAVLYEMLSGKRAFRGDSVASVLSAILRDSPPPLKEPVELQEIVSKCLAKNPQDRFQSMVELARCTRADLGPTAWSGRHPLPSPAPAVAGRITVGREEQRALLWRGYVRVKDGRGLILAVTGEAGIGKTSVLEDFLAELPQPRRAPSSRAWPLFAAIGRR